MVIPVLASDLGLASGASRFSYYVVTYGPEQNDSVDESPYLSYDPAKPGVDFSGGISGTPAFYDVPGSTIAVSYNRKNQFANASQGVLLLHHHNLAGAHAEVVRTPTFLLLPIIRR